MLSVLRVPLAFVALSVLAACQSGVGDLPAQVDASPLGPGLRIADVTNPALPGHPSSGVTVSVTGAAVSWVDSFDETMDGKSIGTVYVQDVASTSPFAGISVYDPSYVPADLRVAPGDVLDFLGPYTEDTSIGTANFPAGQVLPQLTKPAATFRYEYKAPTAAVLPDPTVLNDYDMGRQWMWMLVTVQNVTLDALSSDGSGRVTGHLTADNTANGLQVSNENYNLQATDFPPGTKFARVTGIVTWFFNYHLAPRSAADLVVAQ